MNWSRVAAIVVLWAATAVHAGVPPNKLTPSSADSPMRRLQQEFAHAREPSALELVGSWVEIQSLTTGRFVTGRQGSDRVLFNPHGIRRDGTAPTGEGIRVWEWQLRIASSKRGIRIESAPAWSLPTTRTIPFPRRSELKLDAQFDGDTDQSYRCRFSNDRRDDRDT
jgi:hypothetical protein